MFWSAVFVAYKQGSMMAAAREKLLVVTDLDGTLLDDNYRWESARASLEALRARQIPLVLNSSKTVAELVTLASILDTDAPFVAENGGVLAIPTGAPWTRTKREVIQVGGYHLLLPGLSRDFILEKAHQLRSGRGYRFAGFADWTAAEVAAQTGLRLEDAERARQRWATEPIVWNDTDDRWLDFREGLAAQGIRTLRGGRFIHLTGPADKAGGLVLARDLYQRTFPDTRWRTVALGDSENDLDMLSAADIGVVIPDRHGHRLAPASGRVLQASRPGPAGWHEVMTQLLHET